MSTVFIRNSPKKPFSGEYDDIFSLYTALSEYISKSEDEFVEQGIWSSRHEQSIVVNPQGEKITDTQLEKILRS